MKIIQTGIFSDVLVSHESTRQGFGLTRADHVPFTSVERNFDTGVIWHLHRMEDFMPVNKDKKQAVHPLAPATRRSVGTWIPGMAAPIVSVPKGSLAVVDERMRRATTFAATPPFRRSPQVERQAA